MLNTIDISSQELINFYNSKFYFSYSSLNKLLFSPKMFYKHYVLREKEESLDSHLVEGRLLHCLLLEPEKFDDYFTIVPGKVPSGNNKQIVHDIFNKYNSEELSGKTLNDFEDDIIQVLLSMNLHQTLKTDQQRIDKILISDNIDYFNFLINNIFVVNILIAVVCFRLFSNSKLQNGKYCIFKALNYGFYNISTTIKYFLAHFNGFFSSFVSF